MNTKPNKFAEYVTGMSFVLTLSKRQVSYLNSMILPDDSIHMLVGRVGGNTPGALISKGLIEYKDGEYELTKAGRLLIPLLDEAELLVKSRKTILTTREANEIDKAFRRKTA